jgi:prepilin-type N-terminal cleavage/methylation domain-containing protein
MRNQKGFTLIELLVVIAIIGILSSVVLASLNTARDKGEDAAVKANLANSRAQAELYYDDNDDYDGLDTAGDVTDGVCEDATNGGDISANVSAASAGCAATASAWAAWAPLSTTDTWYCVDSTGAAGEITNSNVAVSDTHTSCAAVEADAS